MDRFFSFLSRNKSVSSFKNRSRTGKTDDFSSPGAEDNDKQLQCNLEGDQGKRAEAGFHNKLY